MVFTRLHGLFIDNLDYALENHHILTLQYSKDVLNSRQRGSRES